MNKDKTTLTVHIKTKEDLKEFGEFGDSYDSIINKLINKSREKEE